MLLIVVFSAAICCLKWQNVWWAFPLSLDDCVKLLELHVPAGALDDCKLMFPYGLGLEASLWKRAPRWDELWKHRSFLEDLLEATEGRVVLHSSLTAAFQKYLTGKKHTLKDADILRVSYRTRCMLAHLRDAKRNKKIPPPRFARLQTLVDSMSLQHDHEGKFEPEPAHGKTTSGEHEPTDSSSDDFNLFSSDPAKRGRPEFVAIDDSGCSSFLVFSDDDDHDEAVDSPPKPAAPAASTSSRIDALVAAAAEIAPIDPRIGDKRVGFPGAAKRPAAASVEETPKPCKKNVKTTPEKIDEPKVTVAELKVVKSSQGKLAYGKAYHAKLTELTKAGWHSTRRSP